MVKEVRQLQGTVGNLEEVVGQLQRSMASRHAASNTKVLSQAVAPAVLVARRAPGCQWADRAAVGQALGTSPRRYWNTSGSQSSWGRVVAVSAVSVRCSQTR